MLQLKQEKKNLITAISNASSLEGYQTFETRRECGQLMAKLCAQGLKLKCKRRKRIVMIPFSSLEGWGTGTHN